MRTAGPERSRQIVPQPRCDLGVASDGTAPALHRSWKGATMETILIVVVLLFLFGGGGYYWNSRRG